MSKVKTSGVSLEIIVCMVPGFGSDRIAGDILSNLPALYFRRS